MPPATQHKPCMQCPYCPNKHWDQRRAEQCRDKHIRRAQRAAQANPQPMGDMQLRQEEQQHQLYLQQQLHLQEQQQLHIQEQQQLYLQGQQQLNLQQSQQQLQQPQLQQPQLQQQQGEAFHDGMLGLSSSSSFPPDWPQESHHGQGLMPHTHPAAAAAQPHPPQQPHQQSPDAPAALPVSFEEHIKGLNDAELADAIAVLQDMEAKAAAAVERMGVSGLEDWEWV